MQRVNALSRVKTSRLIAVRRASILEKYFAVSWVILLTRWFLKTSRYTAAGTHQFIN